MQKINRHLSYANITATLALFIALGGSSYAAVQLSKGGVKTRHIAPSAVTSAKIKDSSLLKKDFKSGQLPTGEAGSTGPTGAAGSDAQFNGATAGGDLTGTYPSPTVAADAVTASKMVDASSSSGLRKADIGVISTQAVSIDPGNIPAQTCTTESKTLSGATAGDLVLANPSTVVGTGITAYVLDVFFANSIEIRFCNITAGAINPAAVDWRILLIR